MRILKKLKIWGLLSHDFPAKWKGFYHPEDL